MGKIDELIKQFCPDGVQKVPLGDVLDYEQPSKYIVKSTEYDNSYNIPVLTAGKGFLLGYTNEQAGVYAASEENPTIIFDDFVTSFHWVDFPFKVKSSAMKMLTCKNKGNSFRFIYYAMCEIGFVAKEHSRHWISVYSKIEIPLPPLAVQKKIVEILDTFTGMIDNLQKELEQRQKQFEYYRSKFFAYNEDECDWFSLPMISENCDRKRKPIKGSKREKGIYPYYGASGIVDYVKDYILDGEYLLISEDGANLVARNTPIAFSIEGKNWVNNHAHVVKFNSLNDQRFVEYYFNSIDLTPWISGGAQPKLNQENLNKILIPYPSVERRNIIVDTLKSFEALISNIKQEIELRQKQYKYYREKLLTFE